MTMDKDIYALLIMRKDFYGRRQTKTTIVKCYNTEHTLDFMVDHQFQIRQRLATDLAKQLQFTVKMFLLYFLQ